jgi:hypothetical protein
MMMGMSPGEVQRTTSGVRPEFAGWLGHTSLLVPGSGFIADAAAIRVFLTNAKSTFDSASVRRLTYASDAEQ